MNPATPPEVHPTSAELAGTPACHEDDGLIHGRQTRMHNPGVGSSPPLTSSSRAPTADDLAGIPVCAEGEEDLTVRPRKPLPARPNHHRHEDPVP
jgi:hypothetical protein